MSILKSSPTHYAARAVHLHAAVLWLELTLELGLFWGAHTQGNMVEWPFAAFALLRGGFRCEAEAYNPQNFGQNFRQSSGIEDFAFL